MVTYAVCGTGNSKFVWAELGGSNSVKPDVSTLCCTGMFLQDFLNYIILLINSNQ